MGNSKTKYEFNDIGIPVTGTAKRTLVGAGINLSLTPAYGAFGYGLYEFDVENGTGFALGGGIKGTMNNVITLPFDTGWYARFGYWNEDFGGSPPYTSSEKGTGYEASFGVIAELQPTSGIKPWIGLELSPLSNFTLDVTDSEGSSGSLDYERRSKLGLRGGIEFGGFYVTVGMMDETSINLGYKIAYGGARVSSHHVSTPRLQTPAISSPHPSTTRSQHPDPSPHTQRVMKSQTTEAYSPTPELDITAQAQRLLQQLGYNPGPADGIYGARTRAAVKAYQRDNGLSVTGRLDAATREMMGL